MVIVPRSKARASASIAAAFEAFVVMNEVIGSPFLRNCSITIPNHAVLLGELQAFEAKSLPSGMTRYAAPEGLHDDCVMSLALAWQGLGHWVEHKAQQTILVDPVRISLV